MSASRPMTCVVFAHNEEGTIERALNLIERQSIWERADREASRIVVACNGCTDRTAVIAKSYAARRPGLYEVLDLPTPGKSRTWNVVRDHLLSTDVAGTIVFSDADVVLEDVDLLAEIDDCLGNDPDAWIASSTPVSHISDEVGFIGRLLVRVGIRHGGPHQVWGCLYGMRSQTLHATVMPEGIPVEDGYLAAMMMTEFLTVEPNYSRIALIDGTFIMLSDPNLRRALRRRTRMVIGVTINEIVFSWIRGGERTFDQRESIAPVNATDVIIRRNEEDPQWLRRVVGEYTATRALPIPKQLLLDGGSSGDSSWRLRIAKKPAQIAFGVAAYVWATVVIRRTGGVGFW